MKANCWNQRAVGWFGLAGLLLGLAASPVWAEEFPELVNTEKEASVPMPATAAAAAFRVPADFHVSVLAAEPEVCNPIDLAWDAAGRLWVAENFTYAERPQKFDLSRRDRILFFTPDPVTGNWRRQVFTDQVQMLTSIEVGLGGVWLMCPPQVLFIPDDNHDGRPDGPATVVLDGFHVPAENYHNYANGLAFGPDGWLYGRCGASAPGKIGRPGTPDAERLPLLGGMWRYHPTRQTVEVLCYGTTNPWGHDWNSLGELFFINTVNGHLWHVLPGAHFDRPHTIDPNPYLYQLIDQHADHYHWDTSKPWSDSRQTTPEHDQRGGGHAHCGLMIYQGQQFPESYFDKLFTLNLHGRRVNIERLERHGAGYVGRHEPDTFFAADKWFRGMELTYGPDGTVYVLDWCDTGECHEHTGVHRTTGRIYQWTYAPNRNGNKTATSISKTGQTPILSPTTPLAEVVELACGANEWYSRQARVLLMERVTSMTPAQMAVLAEQLQQLGTARRQSANATPQSILRLLWTQYATGLLAREQLLPYMEHDHEAVRTWAIRLLTDDLILADVFGERPENAAALEPSLLERFCQLAATDPSGLVRLTLASTLQRLPLAQRLKLATPLVQRTEDANDHNLPLLLWYGLIPVAKEDPAALIPLAVTGQLRRTRQFIARRLASTIAKHPGYIDQLLSQVAQSSELTLQRDILVGIQQGLTGWHQAPAPAHWAQLAESWLQSPDETIRLTARDLGVLFGDGRALAEVQKLALDGKTDLEVRKTALQTLIDSRAPDLQRVCEKLLSTRFLNTIAIRGLVTIDDPEVAAKVAQHYRSIHPSERPTVMAFLVTRPTFARAMLNAMQAGQIAHDDLSAYQARQILSFADPALTAQLESTWGQLRESSADQRAAILKWKQTLTNDHLAQADLSQGRLQFQKICAACHKLYGNGGNLGPDLTGAGRANLDYLLENILAPSAIVTADYRMTVLELTDGRVLNGLVRAQTDETLTLQTVQETMTLRQAEIADRQISEQSLMPDGLFKDLTPEQVRDLIGYLQHPTQVPLPAGTTEVTSNALRDGSSNK